MSIVYIVFVSFFYQANTDYAIVEKKQDLENHLLFQKAMHHYIENVQKPVLYELQEKGTLNYNFFDPRILSFTYIARNTNNKYSELLSQQGLPNFSYRLVSDNARNPTNDGTKQELELLKYFNDNPETPRIDRIIHENDTPYLYVAIPVGANKESCMRCHGEPEDAPKDLLESYGDKRGFYEQIGHKRAFIAFQVSLAEALDEARQFFYLISILVLVLLVGIYSGFVYFYRRLDADKQVISAQNCKLDYLANHDQLTGCYNRHLLSKKLPEQLKQFADCTDCCLVAVLIDVDHFKKINDEYGHDIGDEVLVHLVTIIKQNLTVESELYRLGGEEFLVILPVGHLDEAIDWLQTLYKELATQSCPIERRITISSGVASATVKDTQFTLLKRADQAMYEAKESGRNRFCIG
ncbi:MAG: diguanylate cyclase [Thiomicrorhabdus sp.]|nr:diguanylate cyclase [Thiomicrorhabdus sp.]